MMRIDCPQIKIDIRKKNFDINLEIKHLVDENHNIGAIVSFLGLVRDLSENNDLKYMEIESYTEMSEKVLLDYCNKALERWKLRGISLVHRTGKLYPQENIVLLLIAASHRTEAFNACEFIMDFLKSRAPFWKKETTSAGTYWVQEDKLDKEKFLRW